MSIENNINRFVSKMTPSQRANLYASLLLCEFPALTRQYAIDQAEKRTGEALEALLYRAVNYGLEMKRIDH